MSSLVPPPRIWGPHLWYMLHIISFSYPEQPTEYDKRVYHDFYSSLKDIIPCELCRKHYRDHFNKYPITPHLDTRGNLIKWVIQVHNFVNISLNKPTLTDEQVIAMYTTLRPVSPFIEPENKKILEKYEKKEYARIYTLIIIAFLIILFCKYYFNRYYFSF